MEIYLDNAATTRCGEDVLEAMQGAFLTDFGNPSSLHRKGYEAEQLLTQAGRDIAQTLSVSAGEIVFTSGGTESDNLALIGTARANMRRGRHIITTAIEHAAVTKPAEMLAGEGFDVTVLPVDETGLLNPTAVAEAVREDTILVSVMAVNNEIGAAQDLTTIGQMVKSRNPSVLFHTDAVQGYGKVPIDVKKANIDLLSVSGHKLHGPKGTGFLYVRRGTRIQPILYGGGQQNGLRSGTDNVPGAVGLAMASRTAISNMPAFTEQLRTLSDRFIRQIKDRIADIRVNGPLGKVDGGLSDRTAPHIISLSVPGVRAEVLLHALEEKGIYVSAGSACSSHAAKKHPGTATLRAIGLPSSCLESTIRISLSRETTQDELSAAADALEELVPVLRRFQAG